MNPAPVEADVGRLSHLDHILEMNGESNRLAHSKRRAQRLKPDIPPDDASGK